MNKYIYYTSLMILILISIVATVSIVFSLKNIITTTTFTQATQATQEWQAIRAENCVIKVARIVNASDRRLYNDKTVRMIMENVCHLTPVNHTP